MARQLRIEFEEAFYHITSRGNLRDRIFFDDKDREKFLEILQRTKERYSYLLHAYTLMDNHYHLLIDTPKANISRIMQNINTSYTVHINRKYRRSGHLFQGRFKGLVVDKDEYLVTLSRYIHLNPVRANIVQKPEEHRWSSYNAYIDNKLRDSLVDTADTLSYFSEKHSEAAKRYKAFVEAEIGGGENPFKDVESGVILGGQGFKEKIRELIDRIKADDELPQVKRLKETLSIEKIITVCCSFYDKTLKDLLKKGKNRSERQAAIYLSKVLSGKKNIEVGRYFGIKGSAVSETLKTVEQRMIEDEMFQRDIKKLKGMIIEK
jgi:REP element-mobilizing transposase RayT